MCNYAAAGGQCGFSRDKKGKKKVFNEHVDEEGERTTEDDGDDFTFRLDFAKITLNASEKSNMA